MKRVLTRGHMMYVIGGIVGAILGLTTGYIWFDYTEYVFGLKFITLGFHKTVYACLSLIGMSFLIVTIVLWIIRRFWKK